MYETILVPLDGSRFSEYALPAAVGLARRHGARLELATVAHPAPGTAGPPSPAGVVGDETREEARKQAEAYLEKMKERVEGTGAGVEVIPRVLPMGNVANTLVRQIGASKVDLVVMTTHGRGPLQRAWLGSTADGLVRQASCPVMLHRPEEDGAVELTGDPAEFQNVLVPLDGSEAAEAVLTHPPQLVADGGRITLVRVTPAHTAGVSPYLPHVVYEEHDRERVREAARQYLEEKAEALRARGVEVQVEVVEHDQPALAIIDRAEAADVDLVVMNTEGRGGVSRLVLGSVADKVVRGLDTPVLLHRTD